MHRVGLVPLSFQQVTVVFLLLAVQLYPLFAVIAWSCQHWEKTNISFSFLFSARYLLSRTSWEAFWLALLV